jgi:hypothetical protein
MCCLPTILYYHTPLTTGLSRNQQFLGGGREGGREGGGRMGVQHTEYMHGAHTAFMCFVRISEQTATFAL